MINPKPRLSEPSAVPSANSEVEERKFLLSKVLPSDRITVPEQLTILRGFVRAYDAANHMAVRNSEAASYAKMPPTVVVHTNAFFTDVGLLTRTDLGFLVSDEAAAYARAAHAEAAIALKSLFEKTWFCQEIRSRLNFGPLSQTDAIKALAAACGALPEHEKRVDMLLRYLEAVRIIDRQGGKIWLSGTAPVESEAEDVPETVISENPERAAMEPVDKFVLNLDAAKRRRIVLIAPPSVTSREMARIQQWIALQLTVSDDPPKQG